MSPSEWRITGRPASRYTATIRASRGLKRCTPESLGEKSVPPRRLVVVAQVDPRPRPGPRITAHRRSWMSVIRSSSSGPSSRGRPRDPSRRRVNPRSGPRPLEQAHPEVRGATKCSPPSAAMATAASSSRPGASGSGQAKQSRSLETGQGRGGVPVALGLRCPSRPPTSRTATLPSIAEPGRVPDVDPQQVIVQPP